MLQFGLGSCHGQSGKSQYLFVFIIKLSPALQYILPYYQIFTIFHIILLIVAIVKIISQVPQLP